jgi:hypothetical protein
MIQVVQNIAAVAGGLGYIGPGAGLGLLTALIGFAAAVFAAIAGVLFWPLRRLWRHRRSNRGGHPTA